MHANLNLKNSVIYKLSELAEKLNCSKENLIETAVEHYLFDIKQDEATLYNLSGATYATDEEEKEMIDHLSTLTDDDLRVVETKVVKL